MISIKQRVLDSTRGSVRDIIEYSTEVVVLGFIYESVNTRVRHRIRGSFIDLMELRYSVHPCVTSKLEEYDFGNPNPK